MAEFIELKTTENQTLFVRPEAVGAIEIVPASARVDGHIKLYMGAFKFLVAGEDKDSLMTKLSTEGRDS